LSVQASLESLKSRFRSFVEEVRRENDQVLIISHYDADGLSSFSLMAYFLKKNDVPFHATFVEQVYPETLAQLPFENYSYVVFLDLGSGYKNLIRERIGDKHKVLVIDHHIPSAPEDTDKIVEINPYLAGINGSEETSSSTLTYYFLRDYKEVKSLVHLAIVGALGDRLDNGEKRSFKGINREVLDEAVREGKIEAQIGLRLFGGSSRPLVQALASTMDPFIPGLTGNETACYNFLRNIGIEPKNGDNLRTVGSLSGEEVSILVTGLVKYLVWDHDVSPKEAQEIVERIRGYNYYLLTEKPESPLWDLREYSSLLNALGRLDAYGTALAINLGDRGTHLIRAIDIAKNYRKELAKLISLAHEKFDEISLQGRDTVLVVLEEATPKYSGPLASILSYAVSQRVKSKKMLGVAVPFSEDKYKVSFRRLTEDIDVGRTLQELSRKIGFEGGGHPAAGGALISRDKIKHLLEII